MMGPKEMISSQEKAINALDKLTIPKVNFAAYLRGRAEAEQAVKSAEEFRSQLHDKVLGVYTETGAKLPWAFTHNRFRLRPSEVTLWFGVNGHKKSMVTGFVAVDLLAQGHKVAIISLEMAPSATLGRMMPQAHGKRCHSTKQADEFIDWCGGKLWVYDRRGVVKSDAILGAIYYCAEQLGVTHFFIDSLMMCVKGDDDWNGQKDFVEALCMAKIELNIHIHLIHHSKKIDDPKRIPGKSDAKGSGAITDLVDNVVVVYQVPDEGKQRDSADNMLIFPKQRNASNGWQGQVAAWFDRDSLQFCGKEDKVRSYIVENNVEL